MAGVLIGLKDLYFAEIDETAGTFGTPYRIAKAMTAGVSANVSTVLLYADDSAAESASSEGQTTITLGIDQLTNEVYAKVLGKAVNSDGVVQDSSGDIAPKGALMFRSLKSNGEYRYIVYYKGSFAPPEESFTTKGESIEYNTPTIVGTFVHSDTVLNAKGEGIKRSVVDSDDTLLTDPTIVKNWFTKVYEPTVMPVPTP